MSYSDFFSSIYAELGVMTMPLTVLSLFMVLLILERSVFLLFHLSTKNKALKTSLYSLSFDDDEQLEHFLKKHREEKSTLFQGICMLIGHRQFEKNLREEAVSLWLQEKRRRFNAGLKILQIIGVLSPLLGLLGTVIGLIEMFKNVALTQGAVLPSHLAGGLGVAMASTAAGLLIAVPAVASSQLFTLWANRKLDKIEYALNHINLHLQGLNLHSPIEKKKAKKDKKVKIEASL